MVEFLFWLLLLPITIFIISLYLIIYQFTANRIEAGLKKMTQIFIKIEQYFRLR